MKNAPHAARGTRFAEGIEERDRDKVASVGVDAAGVNRSGSFLQQDNTVSYVQSVSDALELLPVEEFLEHDPEAERWYGGAFGRLGREYDRDTRGGYFIRVKKGRAVEMPLQACLFLKKERFRQKVHNVVIVEEGASLHLITGCASSFAADEGFHLGLSEFFVGKGASLNSTMIHSWKEDTTVRPVAAAVVEEGGAFVSNYISLRPVRDVVMYPAVLLEGAHGRASMSSLVMSHPGTRQDIGARVIFRAPHTRAEVASRTVSLGGTNIARAHLKAEAENVRGHVECRGLVLTRQGTITALPELETGWREVEMSHEAAIGRIRSEEIEYLRSRGMTGSEAQAVIIRGFMNVNILSLPDTLKNEIALLQERVLKGSL